MRKKIGSKYGLEDQFAVTIVPETPGNDIVNKDTVKEAVAEGLKKAEEMTTEEKENLKQIVTVLESIRASMENILSTDLSGLRVTNSAVNAILVNNKLPPIEDAPDISISKENVSKRINELNSFIKQ